MLNKYVNKKKKQNRKLKFQNASIHLFTNKSRVFLN